MSRDLKNMPLITVYIPTYNRIKLLKRAIESVLKQTYDNFEIIVVDDNSNDGTQEYLKEIAVNNKKIRYFFKKENSGACISRNIAINNAKGEYITGLDDDDYMLEQRLEIFEENSELLNRYAFLFTKNLFERESVVYKKNISDFFSPKIISREHLLYNNFVGNQIFIKTAILKSYIGFDEKILAWQDLELWYRILDKNKKSICLNVRNYIMDVNDRKRITTSNKGEKIRETLDYFSNKYNLNSRESKILSSQIVGYGNKIKWKNLFYFHKKYLINIWIYYWFFVTLKNLYIVKLR